MENKFRKIKGLLEDKNDIKEYVGGYYFNSKAVELLQNTDKDYFMNSYYNLTTEDILLMIKDNDNLEDTKAELFREYREDYASALWDNFMGILRKVAL